MQNVQQETNYLNEQQFNELKKQLFEEIAQQANTNTRQNNNSYQHYSIDQETMDNLIEEIMLELQKNNSNTSLWNNLRNKYSNTRDDFMYMKNEIAEKLRDRMGYYDYQEKKAKKMFLEGLKQEIMADLKAQQIYQDYLARNPYPQSRDIINEIMYDIQKMGYTRRDLLEAIKQVQNSNSIRGRIDNWLASPEGRGFKLGTIAALTAIFLLPYMGKSLRPVLKSVLGAGIGLSENVQASLERLIEEVQDIFAEAQYEKNKYTQPAPGNVTPLPGNPIIPNNDKEDN